MGKKKTSPKTEEAPARSFEEALDELREITGELEEGALGLEESMQRFEEGIGLLRHCRRILEEAEQKIEILIGFDEQGTPQTEDYDASATAAQAEGKAGRRKRSAPAGRKAGATDEEDSDEEDSTLF